MMADRTKPEIRKTQVSDENPKLGDVSMCYVWLLISLIIGYFIAHALAGLGFGNAIRIDWIGCWGAIIGYLVLWMWSYLANAPMRKAKALEKKAWIKACTVAQVNILERHEGGSYDDAYGDYHSYPCRLELEMNADQKAASPMQTTVSVKIRDSIYKDLEGRNTVKIYYLPEAPLSFLFEEEL